MPTAVLRFLIGALACAGFALAASADGSAPKGDETVLFGDLPAIEAAALHAQTLAEAPANVTVVTAEEIRRYGCRTLADVLAAVRGDFTTRFLVMLNGHPLTDNIYNSNGFFGQDFGLDMDLADCIEIIRGPTSALYGSNGMLANINVVTRPPVDKERLRISTETDSFGERRLAVSSAKYLGDGANFLVSAPAFNKPAKGSNFTMRIPAGTRPPASGGESYAGSGTAAGGG
jgi:iron complex outermembrane receptor protein